MSVQMTNGDCYLLFEGSKDPMLFTKWLEEPDVMIKGKIRTTFAILDAINAISLSIFSSL